MKRTTISLFALALLAVSMSAQSEGLFLGLRGGAGIGFRDLDVTNFNPDNFSIPYFAGGEMGFGFNDYLSLFLDGAYLMDQRIAERAADIFFPSIDASLLLRYTIVNASVIFALQVGPYVAFPLELEVEGKDPIAPEGILVGVTGGPYLGVLVGSVRLFTDLRVQWDILPASFVVPAGIGASGGLVTLSRRAALLSLGVEIAFSPRPRRHYSRRYGYPIKIY
jgi:hypothetical protein